jgi:hypothetical protein
MRKMNRGSIVVVVAGIVISGLVFASTRIGASAPSSVRSIDAQPEIAQLQPAADDDVSFGVGPPPLQDMAQSSCNEQGVAQNAAEADSGNALTTAPQAVCTSCCVQCTPRVRICGCSVDCEGGSCCCNRCTCL